MYEKLNPDQPKHLSLVNRALPKVNGGTQAKPVELIFMDLCENIVFAITRLLSVFVLQITGDQLKMFPLLEKVLPGVSGPGQLLHRIVF